MMTIAFGCVVIALFFPYLFTILAKRAKPGYNNHYPRDYLASLDGWPKRAHCVQMNSFEAFPAFAAGVIIAHLQGAPQHTVDMLAMAFIVLRIIYALFYLTDKASLRSLAWALGFVCTLSLYFV